jgi:predicted N-acetyltransferase YhbS
VILRPYQPEGEDEAVLAAFACSTGEPFEDEVEDWIQTRAISWVNDTPRATFQRRALAFIEDDFGSVVAVVAWQDVVIVDLDGIWLEVLAVSLDHENKGIGREVYDMTVEHLRTVDRDGDHLAGLVHVDNRRSMRLLSHVGWASVARLDDHELWAGNL